MAQKRARELLGQMLGAAGVERVGHQARVVDCRQIDAVAGQRHHVELGVLHDLEHAFVFEQRLQRIERVAHFDLRALALAAEIESLAAAMRQRHIGRMTRHDGKGDSDQLAQHRIG